MMENEPRIVVVGPGAIGGAMAALLARDSRNVTLVAVKAPQLPDAARRLAPFLREDSLVVSMQNGICIDALSAEVGAGRAVGCGWVGAPRWSNRA